MNNSTTIPVSTEAPISNTLGVCGGSACIRSTRIPVWGLVIWRRAAVNDQRLLEMYPSLSQSDLDPAWR